MDKKQHGNTAGLPLVTLDANALIALRESEPMAAAVQALLTMNRSEHIVVNITLSTALEAGRDGHRPQWADHTAWLECLGISKANIFTGPRTIGFMNPTEPGVIIFDGALERQLNERVHAILRPNIPFSWYDYRNRECMRHSLSIEAMAEYDFARKGFYIPSTPQHPQQPPTPHYDALGADEQTGVRTLHERLYRNWHNAKNDSLGLYNHLTVAALTTHPEWSVFVTSDHHFLASTKLTALRKLGFLGEILPPDKAVDFLRTVIGAAIPLESADTGS